MSFSCNSQHQIQFSGCGEAAHGAGVVVEGCDVHSLEKVEACENRMAIMEMENSVENGIDSDSPQ